ncbi:glycosyltransferase family 2 protein [Gillisia sp. CAL575]|uniref:glycosyltransferase family 2 protein n=1 Tax=Gillisia sp. CAL575 TaxID=985255 RepID=UPI0003AA9B1B|nr:glycosyltransferase family 2 protein [Gillisia sp. CAL575]
MHLVSIIVTCYNQEKYIFEALRSIKDQTYINWECIVIDDGSTDDSAKIIKEYLAKDDRFRYVHKNNGGVSTTRNVGLNLITGTYIQFLDGDDYLEERKIELSLLALEHNHKIKPQLVITNFVLYKESSKKIHPPYCTLNKDLFSLNEVLYNWDDTFSIPIHCGLFDAILFLDFKFPKHIKAKEDWLMWVLIFMKQPPIYFLDKPLAVYRVHPKSITMTSSMFEDHMLVLSDLKLQLSDSQYEKLLFTFMRRYYLRSIRFKGELLKIKRTKFYIVDTLIKKVLLKIGISPKC